MKGKQLAILSAIALVLVIAAFTRSRPPASSARLTGSMVFDNLPVNDVASIAIEGPGGSFTLVREDDQWKLPRVYGYPADFNRIRDTLLQIKDLKIGQFVNLNDTQRQEIRMVPPAEGVANPGTRISLKDKQGKELASLLAGESRMKRPEGSEGFFGGYPDGQYVSPDAGQTVYVVAEALRTLTDTEQDWMDADLLNIPAHEIASITISTPGSKTPLNIVRKTDGQGFEVPNISAKEELDEPLLSAMESCLSFLRLDGVADPAMPDSETGMDKPVVFEATLNSGELYKIRVGATDPASNRYVRIEVALTPTAGQPSTNAPAATSDVGTNQLQSAFNQREALETKTADLNRKFGPWTYKLAAHKVEALSYTRDKVVRPKSPPAKK
ncbi:MAG: hypothetical protein A2498_03405 [Lentisphaerae bacterium RIFOXYC12_FULL_60_16]|nr:MAG: hypothetical protein A2498_03405 [Lentisphaerae bacterium RIFOXYC12_FULL_60_16]